MYVDSSDMCNDLGFHLGDSGSTVSRSWTIKARILFNAIKLMIPPNRSFQITQYDCDYDNLAPDGCTKYHWGSAVDTVKTYNFDGGQHLASQNENICVR